MILRDDAVDALHKQLQMELAARMANQPETITRCLHLMVIAKSLERMSSTKAAQTVDVPVATLLRYVGVYDVVDDNGEKTVVDVSLSGSTLWLDYGRKGKEQLLALTPTRFSWSGAIVEFATPAGAAVTVVLHYAEGSEGGPKRGK